MARLDDDLLRTGAQDQPTALVLHIASPGLELVRDDRDRDVTDLGALPCIALDVQVVALLDVVRMIPRGLLDDLRRRVDERCRGLDQHDAGDVLGMGHRKTRRDVAAARRAHQHVGPGNRSSSEEVFRVGDKLRQPARAWRRVASAEVGSVVDAGPGLLGDGTTPSPQRPNNLRTVPKGSVVQYVGRVLRPTDIKTRVEVHDYVDTLVAVLARMHNERRRAYTTFGFSPPATAAHITPAPRAIAAPGQQLQRRPF